MALTLTSTAFTDGGGIPSRYTCQGDDISPPLDWRGVPDTARSLVLIVDDPDAPDPKAPRMTWVHWVLFNLPPVTAGLPEGITPDALPPGTGQGLNRLEPHRLRWPLPAHRPAPLFSQALRPGYAARIIRQADEESARSRHAGARHRPGGTGRHLPEVEVDTATHGHRRPPVPAPRCGYSAPKTGRLVSRCRRLASPEPHMTDKRVENLNIASYTRLITPEELKRRLPITERAAASVIRGRGVIKDILDHKDRRLFIVVGPCSIHDPVAAIEYGRAPTGAGGAGRGHALPGDARLFREAAQHHRLEGTDQRPAPERLLRDRGGTAHRPPPAARTGRTRPAARDRGARPDLTAIPAGVHLLVGHRRPHRRIADAPGDVERAVLRRSASRTAPTAGWPWPSTRSSPSATRTISSASTPTAGSPSSPPPATATATWCCAAATASPTTIP